MFDLLLTVLSGGATGILGSLLGRVFSFAESWVKEKEKAADHERVMQLTRLQYELGAKEKELEHEIQMDVAASNLRMASYEHDSKTGKASQWVIDTLRMVRPVLTGVLVVLTGVIFFWTDNAGQQESIIQSILYMTSSAVLWWWGDRAVSAKK